MFRKKLELAAIGAPVVFHHMRNFPRSINTSEYLDIGYHAMFDRLFGPAFQRCFPLNLIRLRGKNFMLKPKLVTNVPDAYVRACAALEAYLAHDAVHSYTAGIFVWGLYSWFDEISEEVVRDRYYKLSPVLRIEIITLNSPQQ